MADSGSTSSLSKREHGKLFLESALLAIPYVGSAIERMVSGADTERRWKRIETTLKEVGEKLDALGSAPGVGTEQFAELLATTAGPIASSTAEIRRAAFRELLVNAAVHRPTDASVEEARLAARLLEQIEAPGLEILAKVGLADHHAMVDTGIDPCRVVRSFEELNVPRHGQKLSYDIPVVIEWMHRLRDLRAIRFSEAIRQELQGGGTRTTAGFSDVLLTTLGRLLVQWSLQPTDISDPGDRTEVGAKGSGNLASLFVDLVGGTKTAELSWL